jgi:hypothetical protein
MDAHYSDPTVAPPPEKVKKRNLSSQEGIDIDHAFVDQPNLVIAKQNLGT